MTGIYKKTSAFRIRALKTRGITMEEPGPIKRKDQGGPGRAFSNGTATVAVSIGLALTVVFFATASIYGIQVSSPTALAAGIAIAVFFFFTLLALLKARSAGRLMDSQIGKLEEQLSGLDNRFGHLTVESESRDSAARELISSLSHDMRTSLNALSGWAKILERDDISSNLKSNAIDGITRSIERQSALLDEAAEFLALEEHDALDLDDRIDSRELLSQVVRDVSPNAESRHVELEIADTAKKAVRCDRAKLRKALDKILRTVVRVTPIGGKLLVRSERISKGLRISIRNSGEIDSPKFPFHRLPGVSTGDPELPNGSAGSGLSLAISRRIIEMHGGEVEVSEDAAGFGTEIDVRLPD